MPYISTEALVGGALVVAFAFGYQYVQNTSAEGAQSKKNKKKTKKKGVRNTAGNAGDESTSVPASEIESDTPKPKKGKAGAGKGKSNATVTPVASSKRDPPVVPQPPTSTSTPERDGSESEQAAASFAAAASGSSSKPAKPKTLAEKLVPKPRKTKVDDMLEAHDQAPQLARVMKIVPKGGVPPPAVHHTDTTSEFEDDWESGQDSAPDVPRVREDDGWNVVAAKKKPMSLSIGGSSGASSSFGGSSDQLTKLQRKNQKKADAKKAAKAEDEADRLRRLAMHKRDLEREKINQIYSSQKKVVKQGGKVVSGGATASVSSNGKLVWD